jgi:NAD(P)-dependent dehydrogenase (short-subunit alcohol dehydrogenase family)
VTPPIAGQVVLVTGAARGIGAALARRLAARGARLALAGLEPERLAATCASLGEGHAWVECDVTRQSSLEHAVATLHAHFGRLDVVVANAGIASNGTVAVTPVEALARVIDVNLTGVVRTVHATLPHVRAARGYYLLVSSAAAFAPMPGLATYAASKAGVEQFGNAFRMEMAPHGVGVGTAHLIWIDTDMVRDTQADLPSFTEALRRLPPPFGTIVPLATCAEALAEAVIRRERRVFVPGSLSFFAKARALLASRLAERTLGAAHATRLARLEREVQGLGRAFGRQSMGNVDPDAPGD